jgi:hypothetical protein
MRLTRCALAASAAAASASAFGLPLLLTDSTPRTSDVGQVRMVGAVGTSRSEAELPWPFSTDPGGQDPAPPCSSYGGPYCGRVRTYWGGCDRDWGLSYGIKNPEVLCRHDPRPSPSAAASSSSSASSGSSATPSAPATPGPSAAPSPSAAPGPTAVPDFIRPHPSRPSEPDPLTAPGPVVITPGPSAAPSPADVPSPFAPLSPFAVPGRPHQLGPLAVPSPLAASRGSF